MLDLEPSRGVGPWGFDSPPGTKDCAFVSKDLPNAWFESQKWITTGKAFCQRSVVDLGPGMPRVSIPHIFVVLLWKLHHRTYLFLCTRSTHLSVA
jgi:hypothetical protein